MKYYEKIIIAIIVFLGVTVITAYSIGLFVKEKNKENNKNINVAILPLLHP